MKKLLLTILFITQLFATDYYVDKNATGSNNGTSWTNAWESFADISWGSINPGDFVYISGGADSTIYYEELATPAGFKGTAANFISIFAGRNSPSPSGHSGRVIIDGQDAIGECVLVGANSSTSTGYLHFKGFELRNATSGFEVEGRATNVIVDSMYIYDWSDLAGVFFRGDGYASFYGNDSITVRNCIIISHLTKGTQTDGIYWGGATNTVIHNNYVRMRSQHPTAHVDCLQSIYSEGALIYNNILINDSVYSPEGGGMPFIVRSGDVSGDSLPMIVYNNFCYMGGIWLDGANKGYVFNTHPGDNAQGRPPTFIFHNTIIANGPGLAGVNLDYFSEDGRGVFLNNLVANFGDGLGVYEWRWNFGVAQAVYVDSIRNNLFWREFEGVDTEFNLLAGNPGTFTGNGVTWDSASWAGWVGTLGGTGVNSDPLLVNSIGNEPDQGVLDGQLQAGSPAIDQGEDLTYLINFIYTTYGITIEWKDINGVARDATPTIGAWEYSAATSAPKILGVTGAGKVNGVTGAIKINGVTGE